jgi:deoxyribose-phosphate aldolase
VVLDGDTVIDHTLLKQDATEAEVVKLCQEAAEHSFAAVCVNGCWARFALQTLRNLHAQTPDKQPVKVRASTTHPHTHHRTRTRTRTHHTHARARAHTYAHDVKLTTCLGQVACVVGFPLGASTSETKAFEAKQLVEVRSLLRWSVAPRSACTLCDATGSLITRVSSRLRAPACAACCRWAWTRLTWW